MFPGNKEYLYECIAKEIKCIAIFSSSKSRLDDQQLLNRFGIGPSGDDERNSSRSLRVSHPTYGRWRGGVRTLFIFISNSRNI